MMNQVGIMLGEIRGTNEPFRERKSEVKLSHLRFSNLNFVIDNETSIQISEFLRKKSYYYTDEKSGKKYNSNKFLIEECRFRN